MHDALTTCWSEQHRHPQHVPEDVRGRINVANVDQDAWQQDETLERVAVCPEG
jgi:hypothetical protein